MKHFDSEEKKIMIQVAFVQQNERAFYLSSVPEEVRKSDPVLIGAVDTEENFVCGVLAATLFEDAWEISYIQVADDYQGQGIAGRMIRMLKLMLSTMGIDTVYADYVLHGEKEESVAALDHILDREGFFISGNSSIYKVPVCEPLSRISDKITPNPPATILSLARVSGKVWRAFRERLMLVGTDYDTEGQIKQYERSVYMDPGDIAEYDPNTSLIYMDASGRPSGCLLFSPKEDEGVRLSYLCMLEDTMAAKKALMSLFYTGFRAVAESYGEDTILTVNPQNRVSEQILTKLSGGQEVKYGTVIERMMVF